MSEKIPVHLLDARLHQPQSVAEEEEPTWEDGLIRGYIHSMETVGSVNGPGIRYTVYMSGCALRCLYCHNPDTWHMRMGDHVKVNDVLDDIGNFAKFITVAGGGITVSGGEPLLQPQFVTALFEGVKHRYGLSTCLDTSGALGNRASEELLDLTDLVLLDIKSGEPETHRRVTSAELRPTLDFARRLSDRGNHMWIRFVLVPGLTDAPENIEPVADFVATLDGIDRVEVLPYHNFGEQKYEALRWNYPLEGLEPPSKDQVRAAQDIFKSRGLPVL